MINIKMQHQVPQIHSLAPKITVIGVGGAGGNAVNNMISSNLDGCDFIVCNTDSQALQGSLCDKKIQLGVNITGGLGAGSKPEVGRAAAEETLEEVMRYIDGANMVFVTAGMGGGTGTGAAPVIAKACRAQGILTVGVVTKPFHFEGAHRMEQAERGIAEMQQYVDTLIVIPNQNLFRIANEKTTFAEAFKMADSVLQSGVRGVTDLMVRPGMINLDFADIRTAMQQMGKAMMGTGEASGDKRAVEAAEAAINNPLLDDVSMKGAQGVIINVTGGYDMTLFEADEACNRVRDEVDPKANIIFGATFDDTLNGMIRVSIVATGIESEAVRSKIFSGGSNNTSSGGGFRNDPPTGGGERMSAPAAAPSLYNQSAPVYAQSPAPQVQTAVAAAQSQPIVQGMRPMVSVPSDRVPQESYSQEVSSAPITGRDVLRNLKAPLPIATEQKTPELFGSRISAQRDTHHHRADVASPSEPMSLDMFEQGEFSRDVQNTALRGTTYKDAFIPPMPMEADMMIPESGIGAHISGFHAEHVSKAPVHEASLSGYRPSAHNQQEPAQQKKSMSLFERITGSVQQHIENLRDDSPEPQHQSRPLISGSQGVPAQESRLASPARPSLNMSSPAGKPGLKIDDELDIPAFLRRQAN